MVRVLAVRGTVHCEVERGNIGCQFFDIVPGKGNNFVTRGMRDINWGVANMSLLATFNYLDYNTTYQALGWTIRETAEGTRFTKDDTGHGVVVTRTNALPF